MFEWLDTNVLENLWMAAAILSGGFIGVNFYVLYTSRDKWKLIAVSIAVACFIGIYSCSKSSQYNLQKIHEKDALVNYITTMSCGEVRNKYMTCAIDNEYCTFVFTK